MAARYLETRDVPITDLKPYPGNPKLHDLPALKESLDRNGQYRSVVARQLPDGTLETLAGHGTIEARAEASDTIRAEIIEADDDEARRIVSADNQTGARAGYDQTALLALLDAANAAGGLAGTGWDEDLYADLVKLAEAPDLDDLASEVGDPTEADRHVVLRLSVAPEAKSRFERLMKLTGAPEEADAFSGVLAWASAGARADGLDVEP